MKTGAKPLQGVSRGPMILVIEIICATSLGKLLKVMCLHTPKCHRVGYLAIFILFLSYYAERIITEMASGLHCPEWLLFHGVTLLQT